MTEVMISIQKGVSGGFLAYLIEAPNTTKQHTYGSLLKDTKTDVMNAAYRMAYQKGLKISHIFDEDEGRSLPVHKYKVNETVWVQWSPDHTPVDGAVASLGFHHEGEPRYTVWFGSSGSCTVLESQILDR